MRQKRVVTVAIAMIAVFAVVLISFACSRSGEDVGAGSQSQAQKGEGHAAGHEEHAHGQHAEDDATHEPGAGHEAAPALSGTVENGVRVVEVKARQFAFDPAQVVVQAGETVRLKVTSEDVTHGIGIEGFGIDRRLDPNKTEVIEFKPEKAGSHHFQCSVYCGAGHNDMQGELLVLEPSH